MSERRKYHRRHLIFYLRLLDAQSGELKGFLGDVSPQGMLMISEQPFAVGKHLKLRMQLPHEMEGVSSLEFNAEVRRCEPDYNPQFQAVGLHVGELPPKHLKILSDLLHEMGFKD